MGEHDQIQNRWRIIEISNGTDILTYFIVLNVYIGLIKFDFMHFPD
jgi:hypothetical protein